MKEVTYEDWQKNPTPRMMWCWNSSEYDDKVQRKVVYMLNNSCTYQVLSIVGTDFSFDTFKHCAEIEKHCAEIEKQRRMTNKELARWLREKPTRECKHCNGSNDNFVYCFHTYLERCANEEVEDFILIKEDDEEWREPLVEVEE